MVVDKKGTVFSSLNIQLRDCVSTVALLYRLLILILCFKTFSSLHYRNKFVAIFSK